MNEESERPAFSFNKSLNLKPWNEAMKQQTPGSARRDCTPSKTPWKLVGTPMRRPVLQPQQPSITKTPGWATRRAATHGHGTAGGTPGGGVLKSALSNLPNATQSEFWIQRAQTQSDEGNTQAAIEIIQQGLARHAQPQDELMRALQAYESHNSLQIQAQDEKADVNMTHTAPKLQSRKTGPTPAPKSALSSTTSKIRRKQSLSSKTARFDLLTPLPSTTQKVSFQTPQVKFVQAYSPDRTATNSVSAGSTPYRPRLSFGSVVDSGLDQDLGDEEDLGDQGGSEDEGSTSKELQALVPILERTIGELHDATPADHDSGNERQKHLLSHRFLANSSVTPSGAAHPRGLSKMIQTPGSKILQAVSSSSETDSENEYDSGDSSELVHDDENNVENVAAQSQPNQGLQLAFSHNLSTPDQDPPTPSISPLATATAQGAGQQKRDVTFRVNDLFGVERTPSPVSSNKGQYTPATKMTPMQSKYGSTGLTPMVKSKLRLNSPGKPSPRQKKSLDSTTSPSKQTPDRTPPDALAASDAATTPVESPKVDVIKPSTSLPHTPKSILRPHNQLELGSTSKPSRFSAMRPRVGRKEMKALFEEDGPSNAPSESGKGSIAALSPVRTPAHLKSSLGANEVLVTPVRRSARKSVAPRPTPASQLRRVNYAYMPNPALSERFEDKNSPQQFRDFLQDESDLLEKMEVLRINETPVTNSKNANEVTPLGVRQDNADVPNRSAAQKKETEKGSEDDKQDASAPTVRTANENRPPSNVPEQGQNKPAKKSMEATTRVTRSSMKSKISMSPSEAEIRGNLRRSARERS